MPDELGPAFGLALLFASRARELIEDGQYLEAIDLLKENLYEANIYQLALLAYAFLQQALNNQKDQYENFLSALQYADKVKNIYSEQKLDNDIKIKYGKKSIAFAQFVDGAVRLRIWDDKENALRQYHRLLNNDPKLAKDLNEYLNE